MELSLFSEYIIIFEKLCRTKTLWYSVTLNLELSNKVRQNIKEMPGRIKTIIFFLRRVTTTKIGLLGES
jgi:hypothetical protein